VGKRGPGKGSKYGRKPSYKALYILEQNKNKVYEEIFKEIAQRIGSRSLEHCKNCPVYLTRRHDRPET